MAIDRFSTKNTSILGRVCSHYISLWGNPDRQECFKSAAGHAINVLEWDASSTDEGVNLYATVGASDFISPYRPASHRQEYFCGLTPGVEIASPLAGLGLYEERENVLLGHGHTVPSDDPLWPGSDRHTLLLIQSVNEIIPRLKLPSEVHVEFLQAIPIFDSERTFKSERSAEALLERWESKAVPFWDSSRRANL